MNRTIQIFHGLVFGVLILGLSALVSPVYAVTRNVVASGGSGTSDCTSTACTLSRANAVVQPGDVVLMGAGTYYSTNIQPAVSGTAANRITYRGAAADVSVRAATLSSRAYITLDNIEFESVQAGMVTTNGTSDYITIINCTFNSTDNGVSPTNYSYVGLSIQGDYNVLRDNTFLKWHGGDQVRINGDYAVVEDNDFSKADSGHGNVLSFGGNVIIRGNYFRNRWDRAIEVLEKNGSTPINRLVENNIMFDNNWDGTYPYPSSATDGGGASESGTDQIHKIGGSHTIYRNNLVIASNLGKDFSYQSIVHIGNYDTAYYWENLRIYHNTFHDNPRNGVTFMVRAADGGASCVTSLTDPGCPLRLENNVIKNNIISDQDYYSIWIQSTLPATIRDTHTFEGNILTQSIYDRNTVRTVAQFDSLYSNANNNISTAPTFENASIATTAQNDATANTLITKEDFALAAGSAGKGDALALTTVTANATNATQISVDDAYYFFDGFGLETGDSINIGGDVRTVTDVVNGTTLQVTPAVTVASGDEIYLAEYGTSPDRGAYITANESNTSPTLSITTVTDPNPDSTPSVTGSVADSDGTVSTVQYQMNSTSGSWSSCSVASGNFTCNVSSTLSNGVNTIYVRATDNDGGTTTSSDSFVVDTVAPSVSITALSPDPTNDATPTLSGTATDANSTVSAVSYQVGSTSGSWTACTALDGTFDDASDAFSCTVSPALSDGSYTIYFKATDVVSNTTTSSYTSDTFTVENSLTTWRFDTDTAADFTYDTSLMSVNANGASPVSGVNKLSNPAFASDHGSWSVAPVSTSSGWALVPGNSETYSTSDFFVMQYEAKYDCTGDGVGDTASTCTAAADSGLGLDWRDVAQSTASVVSSPQGIPIVHISQSQAASACPAGTHLITSDEWMTIARNAEVQTANWADGVVGSTIAAGGGLKRGNVGTLDSVSYNGTDPEQGTSRNDKAKLVLSNGSEFWDLSGNVLEWNNNTIQRKDLPVAWNGTTDDTSGNNNTDFASGSLSRYLKEYKTGSSLQAVNVQPSNLSYNANHGVGRIYHYSDPNDTSTSVFAYERGGSWFDSSHAGLFNLKIFHLASYQGNNIGFRCATGAATTQTYAATSGRSGGGGETVTATSISDVKIYQSVNVGDTSTYDLSVYVYDSTSGSEGGTVSSSVAQLFYNGSTVSTTYTDQGSGWWKLTGTVTGADASREYGLLVEAGKTVIVDDFTLSKNGTYAVYNTTAYSVAGIQSWDSFSATDTASGSASIKFQVCTDDGSSCQSGSSWKYWDGDSWETASNTTTHVNTEAELTSTAMQALPVDTEKISVKSIMSFGGADSPDLDSITVTSTTDTTAPIITLTAYVPDPGTDTTPTLIGTAAEENGTVTAVSYQVDSTAGAWSACTADDGTFDEASEAFSCTVGSALDDGSHTIYVRAVDSNSNTTPSGGEQSDDLSIDTTAPTVPGTPSTVSATDNPTPTWTWTASTDAVAGLDSTPYTIEWSTDNTFATAVSTFSDIPNTFTHSEALTDGTWYIRVKATDTLGNTSTYSSSGSITIDTTDPVAPGVSLTAYSPDPGTDATPSVTGTTSDSDSTIAIVEYQVDSSSGVWSACSADDGAFDEAVDPFTCTVSSTLSDGSHTIYVRALDSDSLYSTNASDSFIVDTTAPSISVTAYSPDPTNDTTPTVTGTVSDTHGIVSSVSYQMNSTEGSWTSCTLGSGTFSCTVSPALSDGSNTIYFKAADSLSNETSSSYPSDTFVIDATGPTAPGTPASNSPENDTTPLWGWTVSTDAGVGLAGVPYTVEWSTDNTFAIGVSSDTSNTNSYTHTVALADGTWYFRVKAEDTIGNESSYSSAGSFVVNTVVPPTEPPTVSLTAISPDPGTDSTPTITGTAADPDGTVATVQYQVDSSIGTWNNCTASDGTFDGASEVFSCTVGSALSDGAHTIYIRVTADDGQFVDGSDSFAIDTGAPTAPGTPATTTPTTDTTPTWAWTASTDSGVGLAVPAYTIQWSTSSDFSGTVESSTATSNSFTHSSALADGTWYFRVKSTDGVANETSYSSAGSVVIDTTAPSAPGAPSTTTPTNSTSQNWSWTSASDAGSGVAEYAWRIVTSLGAAVSNGTTAATSLATNLTQGVYSIFIKAVDSVDNESSEATSSLTVDTDAATITLPTISPDPSTDSTPVYTGSAADNLTALTAIEYRVDSGSWTACAADDGAVDEISEDFTCTLGTLSDGSYSIQVRTTDTAGNTNTGGTVASDTLTIDSTAPSTPGTPSSASSSDDATPTWTWSASTDAGEGLAATPYTLQWSQASDFSTGVTSSTATTNSFTHTSNLSTGTWYFRVKAADELDNESSYSSAGSFVYTGSLAISSVDVSESSTSATITWTTNIASSSQVYYGVADSGERSTTEADTSTRVTSHSVVITSLVACSRYEYVVRSASAAGNEVTSTEGSFTTTGCTGDAQVYEQVSQQVASTDTDTVSLSVTGSQTASLSIPQNVTANPTMVFQIFRVDKANVLSTTGLPSGYSSIVGEHAYELKAFSDPSSLVTSFDEPITFTIAYTAAGISGFNEDSLALFRWDGSTWYELSGCTHELFTNSISCTTTAFSTFAMVGEAAPAETTTNQTNTSSSTGSSSSGGNEVCSTNPPSSVPQIFQVNAARGSAQLYINPAGGDTTDYTVVYGFTPTDERFSTRFAQTRPTGSIVHTINHLDPNTTYYFKVQAHNGCASTAFSSAFGSKTTRFFWQKQASATSLKPTTTKTAPKSTFATPTVESQPSVSVTPQPTITPPSKDTTEPLPNKPSDPPPAQKKSWWQSATEFFSGIFK